MLMKILSFYLIAVNVAGFLLFAADKQKARRHAYRIPEKTLFLAAALGGAAGCFLSMHLFRHKTRHLSFLIGIPAILFAWCILLVSLYRIIHF